MNIYKKRIILWCVAAVSLCIVTFLVYVPLQNVYVEMRKNEAEKILELYSGNIELQTQGPLNEASQLAGTIHAVGIKASMPWFKSAAAQLLEREEVRFVGLIEGDTVVSAQPEEKYKNWVGRNLKDLHYIYTMVKVLKEHIVEGPVMLDGTDESVFLFLSPILDDSVYLGNVIVALDKEYMLEQLGLDYFRNQGYDYELWRVDPQTGNKETVSKVGETKDFSQAVKINFYLPTQWTLSIQPAKGWLRLQSRVIFLLLCIAFNVILLSLIYCVYKILLQKRRMQDLARLDRQTGLYSRLGFVSVLEEWLKSAEEPISLFYFTLVEYNYVVQFVGRAEEAAFLKDIPRRFNTFIRKPFIAGRVSDGDFIVAVRGNMSSGTMEDFAQGLSLELFWKICQQDKKIFLNAQYEYLSCVAGQYTAEEYVAALVNNYYSRIKEESPIRALTEKCRQLIEGQTDVVFDEYTDIEMMELSKTFNQYRKQVEQLAYFDPVFQVGNRTKYFRDTNMLISYDKKRKFRLFCVDICSFSKYNDLFSANTGDLILYEVVSRLSRFFGNYLYRINGDVFLGISLSVGALDTEVKKIQKLLKEPVIVGANRFTLNLRVAVCQYPDHAREPDTLLDRIQSALGYAKKEEREVIFYNEALDKLLYTEARIQKLLREGVKQGTLEVWYQPILNTHTGRFDSVEALVRLSDGTGGYYPAGQVISIAEKNGMVEQIGDYVLGKACSFMAECGRELGLTCIGVNLSVQQLLVDNCVENLLSRIKTSGIDPRLVTLEITESVLIESIEKAVGVLIHLRQAGIHIALDDFGVGYSSLNYLSNLPIDTIKIDRSLMQQVLVSPKQYTLLRSIVELADINDLTVVVEGVETPAEKEAIFEVGVDHIQGFYYAPALPPERLQQFLKQAPPQK